MAEGKSKLYAKLGEDLIIAMKAKDEGRLSVLRMLKSKILYVNARGDLPDAEIVKIINKYKKELIETIEELKKLNKPDEIEQNKKELKIVEEYLPPEISPDQIKEIVKNTIAELGAASMKDMGAVMKKVQADNPAIDGKAASLAVRELLK
ncbi:MAG: GatB/YqeY domain-containing protein [Candidatus Margulisiibacteriota bacterium]|nr:GatB/YqeY domain-containing protein [Candidatus Margulisiibacteriota bacterium]